jgi:hypothetical protein
MDGHLDAVTATLARAYMTDFVVPHVRRRLWRDQQVIAFAVIGFSGRNDRNENTHSAIASLILPSPQLLGAKRSRVVDLVERFAPKAD